MSNKKNVILLVVAIGIIVVATTYYVSSRVYSFYGNRIQKVTIDGRVFYAEIVSSSDKLQKGLGGRNYLCRSCAMLFEFSRPDEYVFWMKDMRFDLDIFWISGKKVVAVEKNISKDFSGTLASPVATDQVLEINAGLSDEMGIKTGDAVNL